MARIEIGFGPKPSREPVQPTAEQVARANLGAVRPDSPVGRSMIAIRNSEAPASTYHYIATTARDAIRDTSRGVADRTRQFVHDAGPAIGVTAVFIAAGAVLAACGPDVAGVDGGAGHLPTDGGAGHAPADGSQIPDFGSKVADCVNANPPQVHPGDVPQPTPADPPASFEACKIAVINGTYPPAPQP